MMPGVVDEDVDAPEPLDRRVDQRLAPSTVATSLVSATAVAAGGDDLGGDGGRRRPASAPVAVHRAAEVVDDDAGAPRGEQARVGAADAAPRAGDDRDAPVEAVLAQAAHRGLEAQQVAQRAADHGALRSSSGTPANCWPSSSRLPRKVPSACG